MVESFPYDHDNSAFVRIARRDFERAIKVPSSFISDASSHFASTYQAWTDACLSNKFKGILPMLEKTLVISRQMADFFPGYDHIADPLIDFSDYGLKANNVRKIIIELRQQLIPLVQTVTAQEIADDSCLHKHFPEKKQLDFSAQMIKAFGFNFSRGRQDQSPHPFTISLSIDDVRITTRIIEGDLSWGFFSTTHEAGHPMYEQGIKRSFEDTPLKRGTSSSIHESQSRTWENLVSRSRPFWEYFYPHLQKTFPEQLNPVSLDSFYRAVNKVQRSVIRTEADELTYNLHVMIRFELELQLMEGELAVKDLPEAWRAAYQRVLGLSTDNDSDGCMQDIHWFSKMIGGAFQGYTLGNIISAQFFERALQAHPEIPQEFRKGEFHTLRNWLTEHIYQHGRKFTTTELIQRITGEGLSIGPYIRYLKKKFSELHKIEKH